jgi:hypothetical protein
VPHRWGDFLAHRCPLGTRLLPGAGTLFEAKGGIWVRRMAGLKQWAGAGGRQTFTTPKALSTTGLVSLSPAMPSWHPGCPQAEWRWPRQGFCSVRSPSMVSGEATQANRTDRTDVHGRCSSHPTGPSVGRGWLCVQVPGQPGPLRVNT